MTVQDMINKLSKLDPNLPMRVLDDGEWLDVDYVATHKDPRYGTSMDCAYVIVDRTGD